ncbi:Holliday junction branch migration protein RuvA [Thiohalobacter sp. IOR34]|uniref:Holliday junction branch migration protein RuvA n=1 Tax=Thiohalobacter sp. IOR34 TaxID=3057176 RepID=UPI0025AFFB6B|nr:Holliday junction branch migration protein RuvA [Thiohalobacter sp. IOR34]WJW74962.1 Holliday junction branch migration protein RuvA [Thiohalobacter sp. IOR34]
MIGFLRGRLVAKRPPQLLLEVGGVGYEIDAPMTTFYDLPETGAEITLHTHLVVREDAHTLYGFGRLAERSLFRSLIRISGVGPRLALAILSGMNADEFVACVREGDSAALTRVPGIGKKTAERLVVELRDRLDDWAAPAAVPAAAAGSVVQPTDAVAEAVSALIALGYKPPEASRMVRAIDSSGLTAEAIIRQALQATVRPS